MATGEGRAAFQEVTWRPGSRGALCSSFAALHIRPADRAVERAVRARACAEQGWWDGILHDLRLLTEWPPGAEAPTG
ncbi:hypothetical protein [Streptomyces violascens]|uniref:hypothetical protein n=1 Tax=Streptomyces violascens TaxID=67381 RepID=UPI0036897B24